MLPDIVLTQTALTDSERALFVDCEQMIGGALIYAGKALRMIMEGRLWRDDYQSFDHYTRAKWGWSSQYAYQLIQHFDTYQATGAELTRHSHYRELEKASYGTIKLCADLIPKLDKINARTLAILVEVVEVAIATGTIEISEGEQLRLNQITALQAATLLEQVETRKRQLDHINGKNPPIASFSKAIALDFISPPIRKALNIDSDSVIDSIEVSRTNSGFTIRGKYAIK